MMDGVVSFRSEQASKLLPAGRCMHNWDQTQSSYGQSGAASCPLVLAEVWFCSLIGQLGPTLQVLENLGDQVLYDWWSGHLRQHSCSFLHLSLVCNICTKKTLLACIACSTCSREPRSEVGRSVTDFIIGIDTHSHHLCMSGCDFSNDMYNFVIQLRCLEVTLGDW